MTAKRPSILVRVLLIAISLALGRAAFAEAGPPLITDDPGTPERGHFEINTAFTYDQKVRTRSIESPLIDFNYGLLDHLQLKLEFPWESTISNEGGHHPSGFGGSLVGLKGRFLDEDKYGVAMSIYPQFEFGWSSLKWAHDHEPNSEGLILPTQIEKKFGPIIVGADYGIELRRAAKPTQFYGIAMGHEFSERFELLGEVHGTSEARFRKQEWLVNGGFRLKLSQLVSLLASTGTTIKSEEHDHSKLFSYFAIQFRF